MIVWHSSSDVGITLAPGGFKFNICPSFQESMERRIFRVCKNC
jgi:hypothetical protein